MTVKPLPQAAPKDHICRCDESVFMFDDAGYLRCKDCGGRAPKPDESVQNRDCTCPACRGTGRRNEKPCTECGGWGVLW